MNIQDMFAFRFSFFLRHLLLSATVVALVTAYVLLVLYPSPLAHIEGVLAIIGLIIAVDVCLGPLLTFLVASPQKPRKELWRDLSLIGLVQIAALGYGTWAMVLARPAFIVFDVSRFETVRPRDLVDDQMASLVPTSHQQPSLWGPKWVYAEPPASMEERLKIMSDSLSGGPEFKNLPRLFRVWPHDEDHIRRQLRDLADLEKRRVPERNEIFAAAKATGLSLDQVAYVPLLGTQGTGVVLIRRQDLAVLRAFAVSVPL